MAMTMTGEYQLAANREKVWAALNDAEVLKRCIPGCEELNKVSDTEFQAFELRPGRPVAPAEPRIKGRLTRILGECPCRLYP